MGYFELHTSQYAAKSIPEINIYFHGGVQPELAAYQLPPDI